MWPASTFKLPLIHQPPPILIAADNILIEVKERQLVKAFTLTEEVELQAGSYMSLDALN